MNPRALRNGVLCSVPLWAALWALWRLVLWITTVAWR